MHKSSEDKAKQPKGKLGSNDAKINAAMNTKTNAQDFLMSVTSGHVSSSFNKQNLAMPQQEVVPIADDRKGNKAQTKKGRASGKKKRKLAPAGIMALFLAILILTLSAGIVLVQFVFFQKTSRLSIAEEDRISGRLTLALDAADATVTYPLGTNLLLHIDTDKLRVLNLKGIEELALEISLQNPAIQPAGEKALVVDRLGYQYYVLQANGLLYSGSTESPILGYHLSDEGYLALLLEAEGTKGIVRVLKPTGEFLFDWTIQDDKESGYVLAAKFGFASQNLFVSMLNVAGAKPFPIIKKISLQENHFREIIAQYSPPVAEALPIILPLNFDQTVFVGQSSLHLLEGDQLTNPLNLVRVARAGQVGRGFYLLASNQASGSFHLNMINGVRFPYNIDEGYVLQDFPREVASSKAYMAMSVGDDLYRFSLHSNQPEIFRMQGKLLRFNVADDGSVLCICTDGVRQITR